ncbi:hypothetical protein OAN307_c40490 [Octadecabacter antarcticus 307]|uniref:Uncharacterized protein n=1 Tax=Octadecabacter antarcticus 307 TaxID=391626 RepID=B5J283_9RHOB|nr:hypothetical protein OAN307_c40490 [Octadecabacter antarcticus 307]
MHVLRQSVETAADCAQKARLSHYIMLRHQDFGLILDRLGKHKKARAFLYINKLADVDMAVVQ